MPCFNRLASPGWSRPALVLAATFAIGLLVAPLISARGAAIPWLAYEAEDGMVKGGAIFMGPGRKLGTLDGEASGRKTVLLNTTGASIEWVAKADANSIVVRNSIPDAPNGGGTNSTLSLYINVMKKASLKLTSAHSWIYGGDDTQTDNPANGPARKLYDETQLLFNGFTIAMGDVVQLKKDADDGASIYAIDFIDLEQVAPALPIPAGYVSITEGGHTWAAAVPDDDNSDDDAINQCILAAQSGKYAGVYIPPGTYDQSAKYQAKNVKIQGAGMWYSKIFCGNRAEDVGAGKTGFVITGNGAEFRDFAIFGWGGTRTQGGKAFVNSAFQGTILERIWIESVQCGYWVGGMDESTGLIIKDCRIRNTGADGVNLCNGNLNGLIVNCHARHTGDDAFAIWSATDLYKQPCRNNVIRDCTVQITWRAACFAIYGGTGNRIENCLGSDALTYPGLTVSTEFAPFSFTSATVDGLTLNRCGGSYWTPPQQFGAVWVFAAGSNLNDLTIRNVEIVEPSYQGLHLQGRDAGSMNNVLFENVTITNPTTYGVVILQGTNGGAIFRNVNLVAPAAIPIMANLASGFKAVTEKGSGSSMQPLRFAFRAAGSGKEKFKVEFTVPGSGARPRRVRVSLNRPDGRRRHLLVDGLFFPGFHRLSLDGNLTGLENVALGSGLLAFELD